MTRVAKISTYLLLLVSVGALAITVLTEPEAEHGPAQPPPVRASAPIQIPGVEIESHDHVPPMIDSNGNLYRVTEDDEAHGNRPRVMKSSDGGETWLEQDAARRPTTGDTEGGWALQDGPTIWFAWQKSATVHLTRFNTSDHPTNPDSYQVQIEDVASPSDPGPQYASLAENDDGSLWIAYGASPSGGPRSALVKRNADGTYGSPITLDAGTATTAPRLVKGSGDSTYVFYKDHDHHRIYYRSLSPTGALSPPTRVDSGGTHTTETPLTNVVRYSAGGAEVLVVMYAGPDGILRSVAVRDGIVGPEQQVSSTPVTIDPGVTTNLAAVAHLAVAGTTVIAMWSDATDGHVYRDQRADHGQWGSDTLTVDTGAGTASTAQYVYANVLRHTGGHATVGFTYDLGPTVDDESNIFYGQVRVSTGPGTAPGPPPATVRLTADRPPAALTPGRTTRLRLRVRDDNARPLVGRTLDVLVRDTATGAHSSRQVTSEGDRTRVPVRGYAHATEVVVRDAASGAGLTLAFRVEPLLTIRSTRTAPGRFTVRGTLRPAVATRVVLQRKVRGDWARAARGTTNGSGEVTFAGQRPATYRLRAPASGDRVATHSQELTVPR